jgi:glycosyltransferase involved in cell wall biosynthesis
MKGISVVTATYLRPTEVRELLDNLTRQTVLPMEVILIDGAPPHVTDTERTVMAFPQPAPFEVRYIRKSGGTAIQRNEGIDAARGDFIAFIDDDVRLEPDYFERMLTIYKEDTAKQIGGIAGYITNQYIDAAKSLRWRWFRRLRLFSTFEPGRYDYQTGYTINRYLQPPHDGLREIDWMGSNCGVWRSEVFAGGLRFSEFFKDYGMLEDAHLALRAGRSWRLLENGAAHCVHLHAPGGRVNMRRWARKTAVNFRFVFVDIVPRRSLKQELRFWGIQVFDLFRLTLYAFRMQELRYFALPLGKAEGIIEAAGLGLRRR